MKKIAALEAENKASKEANMQLTEQLADSEAAKNHESALVLKFRKQLDSVLANAADMKNSMAGIDMYRDPSSKAADVKHRLLQSESLNRLDTVIQNLRDVLAQAQAHAQNCKARGFYANRSSKLHDNIKYIFDELVDYGLELDTGKPVSRLRTLEHLKRITNPG